MGAGLSGFGTAAVLLYILVRIFQSGMDSRLTKDGYERAIHSHDLVYYDQRCGCFRSTKTKQKAKKVLSRDMNGVPFEYVVTDGVGTFIEARYTNPQKWDQPVLFDDYHREMFFGGK